MVFIVEFTDVTFDYLIIKTGRSDSIDTAYDNQAFLR